MPAFPRARSISFIVSGAIGGFVGFLLMEGSAALLPKGETAASDIRAMAIYFAGFGLAVGAALGATEGLLRKNFARMAYGLSIGLVLGLVAGAVGGAAGQWLFSLVQKDPVSRTDVVIALDSSGSMLFKRPKVDVVIALDSSGSMIAKRPDVDVMIALDCSSSMDESDPLSQRAVAATAFIGSLAANDRVGIVHFMHTAQLAWPLDSLGDVLKRAQAIAAARSVHATGGTNLDAGLGQSIVELLAKRVGRRSQQIVFLTDGVGAYSEATGQRAAEFGITIHTVGLGSGVNAALLGAIAAGTRGKYYPVARASDLTRVFQEIFDKHMANAQGAEPGSDPQGKRRAAAKRLIGCLDKTDRVAIVDFDDQAKVLWPLQLVSDAARVASAKAAVDQVDDAGGTSLTAGLTAALSQLRAAASPSPGQASSSARKGHIVFLTDGMGDYSPDIAASAAQAQVTIHTIGLGADVNSALLGGIAKQTRGRYYPVENADQLEHVFQEIFDQAMASSQSSEPGSDPEGKRRTAAKQLIDTLSKTDRVAVVDFDDQAKVLWKLLPLADAKARASAKQAIDKVNDAGGTNLTAGLGLALDQLGKQTPTAVASARQPKRNRHVIFLTDGMGAYDPAIAARAVASEVKIHTIGLGPDVDSALLGDIARKSGGSYYPVEKASDLIVVFQKIFHEHLGMADAQESVSGTGTGGTSIHPLLLLLARVVSWGVMGLAIGFGQGIRENSWEDLLACSLGGLMGGLAGGMVFDPITRMLPAAVSLLARAVGDTVVGACIGGSMRAFQAQLVLKGDKPVTTLIGLLPRNERSSELRMGPRRGK